MKKERRFLKPYVFIIAAAVLVALEVLLDQLTKIWIYDGLLEGKQGNSVQVLGNFLKFQATLNNGAAFGILQSSAADIVFLVITILGLPLFGVLLWRSRTRSVWGQVGFAFIIGGTIGNAIDRMFVNATEGQIYSGGVRDFISFSIFPPIFNVADSFLTIGVILAIVAILFLDPDALLRKPEKADDGEVKND